MAGNSIFKFTILTVLILNFGQMAKADTRELHMIYVPVEGITAYRTDTISLENENDLVIKGINHQEFPIQNDVNNIYTLIVEYVADKDGNRVKYTLVKEPVVKKPLAAPKFVSLNSGTLKSMAG